MNHPHQVITMAKEAFSNPEQIPGHITGTVSSGGMRSQIRDHSAVPNLGPFSSTKTGTVVRRRRRLRDVESFPIGTRVITPLGYPGVVIKHQGAESKDDMHERCVVQYQLGRGFEGEDRNMVTLLPHLLKLADEGLVNRW
ncbi:MAG: hypothetical protein WBF84_06715 [Castellaniella sp.]|uniref:hypothetical protein n=1 Tax=Castellaniella sp. TaxID=1955812 RepID=UPI003C7443C3